MPGSPRTLPAPGTAPVPAARGHPAAPGPCPAPCPLRGGSRTPQSPSGGLTPSGSCCPPSLERCQPGPRPGAGSATAGESRSSFCGAQPPLPAPLLTLIHNSSNSSPAFPCAFPPRLPVNKSQRGFFPFSLFSSPPQLFISPADQFDIKPIRKRYQRGHGRDSSTQGRTSGFVTSPAGTSRAHKRHGDIPKLSLLQNPPVQLRPSQLCHRMSPWPGCPPFSQKTELECGQS